MIVDVRPTNANGLPAADDSQALAVRELLPIEIPRYSFDFIPVDFSSSNVKVKSGELLAIVLRTEDDTGGYNWQGGSVDEYVGGKAFYRGYAASEPKGEFIEYRHSLNNTSADFGFRTYVVVPEPATGLLLLVAICASVIWRRHR